MREIEYRAWLKGEREMVEVKTIHFGTRKIMYGYSAGVQNYGNASCGFDDCEIMQFTGLKDKNGVKVYEGDFVKSNHNADVYRVYWQDCRFYIEDERGNLIKPKQTAINHFECEVVGNLWDNPELIKESE